MIGLAVGSVVWVGPDMRRFRKRRRRPKTCGGGGGDGKIKEKLADTM